MNFLAEKTCKYSIITGIALRIKMDRKYNWLSGAQCLDLCFLIFFLSYSKNRGRNVHVKFKAARKVLKNKVLVKNI